MKLVKGGLDVGVSDITTIRDGGKFLLQCPSTGIVYVLHKMRSSMRECYYITPQCSTVGNHDVERSAVFQRGSDSRRRVHFSNTQIDWAIRTGNFTIERV